MSITMAALPSLNLSSKTHPLFPRVVSFSVPRVRIHNDAISSRFLPTKIQASSPQFGLNCIRFSRKIPGISLGRRMAGSVNAGDDKGGQNNGVSGGADVGLDKAEKEARGQSTMPERFRYLSKEAPDPPIRWPWFVVLGFLIYAWRAVLFELSNWRNAAFGIVRFIAYLLKYALAVIFHFIGDPVTFFIRCVEDVLYNVRAFYSGIVAYTPVSDLIIIIVLASVVLSIAEATVPNCINSQPYVLTLSGLIGYAAVRGYISEPLFWTLLLGLYGFSRLVKKRDHVSAAMPAAAVLAAVGEPWVRVLVMISYVALAIYQHTRSIPEDKEVAEVEIAETKLPFPLLVAALAIGIRIAAKWAGYRHLTWMIL